MSPSSQPVIAVLLAAGASTRMGQPKQLMAWKERPLLVHSIEQLLAAGCENVVVVLGSAGPQCQRICELYIPSTSPSASRVIYAQHSHWHDGQASSLRFGMGLAKSITSEPYHLLVAVSDQPLITSTHYRSLIQAIHDQRGLVAATGYPEGGGVPACFHHQAHFCLDGLGDEGAKKWIRQRSHSEIIEFDFGTATHDVDTVDDWLQLGETV